MRDLQLTSEEKIAVAIGRDEKIVKLQNQLLDLRQALDTAEWKIHELEVKLKAIQGVTKAYNYP